MTLQIHSADWVLPVADSDGRPAAPVREGAVAIDGERIVTVGPRDDVLAAHSGAPESAWDGVLMPGLVNAHTHLQYTGYADLAGQGLPFPEWIGEMIRRRGFTTDADWVAGAAEGARLLLATGTTSAADDVSDTPAVEPVGASGLGGISYLEQFGYNEAAWADSGRAILHERLAADWGNREIGTMAHAIYTLDPGPFSEILRAAAERGLRSQFHLDEPPDEHPFVSSGTGSCATTSVAAGWDLALVREGGAGISPTRFIADLGCLSPGTHAAHGVHCSADDRALLRAHGVVVALCPRSNRILQSGTPPIADYLREGSPIALGTDSLASSPSLDLLDEVRAAYAIARDQGYDASDLAARLLLAATYGGAQALGRHRVDSAGRLAFGALHAGAQADLAVMAVDDGGDIAEAVVHSGHCIGTILKGRLL